MHDLFIFLMLILLTTLGQLVGLFGGVCLLGGVLWLLQWVIAGLYLRKVGWRALLWTAWLGVPVHEAGHALLALIFGHRINEVALFRPNPGAGTLGYVNHTFNRKNLYQRIGNLFIGAAPLISGACALYGLVHVLLPNRAEIFALLAQHPGPALLTGQWGVASEQIWQVSALTLAALFAPENLGQWSFWLFLYLSLCVASHLAPSPKDLHSVLDGLLFLLVLLLVANAVAVLAGVSLTGYLPVLTHFSSLLVQLLLFAILLACLHLLAASTLLAIVGRRKR